MEKETTVYFKTIDEYMATLSDTQRAILESMRQIIKQAAPKAEETISYNMPAFTYRGMLVYFAAFKNHCSLFPANSTLIVQMAEELKPYKTSKGTISFPLDKPLPKALIKKIVNTRMAENEAKVDKKKASSKDKETETVAAYMSKLEHPLKAEIEAVRTIIKEAHPQLVERIKWNAPSYYYKTEDLLTFNHRLENKVHLIFHNAHIVNIKSDLLMGDYKDRRMMYFANMDEVHKHKKELQNIVNEYVNSIDIK